MSNTANKIRTEELHRTSCLILIDPLVALSILLSRQSFGLADTIIPPSTTQIINQTNVTSHIIDDNSSSIWFSVLFSVQHVKSAFISTIDWRNGAAPHSLTNRIIKIWVSLEYYLYFISALEFGMLEISQMLNWNKHSNTHTYAHTRSRNRFLLFNSLTK